MITQGNIENLYKISSNLSMKDYLAVNKPEKKRRDKNGNIKHVPYSLSDETREATDYYKMAMNKNINIEDEEKVKAYLLKIMFTQPELLYDNPNYLKWKSASNYKNN